MSAAPPAEALKGVRVDASGRAFELIRLLGSGGFGEVYLARMHSPGGLAKPVAVKLLKPGLDADSQPIERLRDEARLLVSLRHPVVLAADDLVVLDGRVALVTEFIDGQDLSEIIRDAAAPIPPSALLEAIEAVASALDAAWNQLRVVHRDIKPQNIRIGVHGNVKLLDFGIARSAIGAPSIHTGEQSVLGTAEYLAPERYEADREPTPASDVFALGCVLFEGLTGERLFARMSFPAILGVVLAPAALRAHVQQRLGARLSAPLTALVTEMLAYDPPVRPTAAEVAQRCEGVLAGWDGAVPLRRWCRDRRWPEHVVTASFDASHRASRTSVPPTPVPPTSVPPEDDGLPVLDVEPDDDEAAQDVPSGTLEPAHERASLGTWLRWTAVAAVFSASAVAAGVGMVGIVLLAQAVGRSPAQAVLAPIEAPPAAVAEPEPEPVEPEPEPDAPVEAVEAPAPRQAGPKPSVRPRPAPRPAAVAPRPAPARDVAPTLEITLGSRPMLGAKVIDARTGKVLGTTLLVRPFPVGDHDIRLVAPTGEQTQHRLVVREHGPTRYIWNIAEDRLEAGQ